MHTLKWTPFFSLESESLIVPVWISLPRLPIHLFNKGPLFSIARLIGEPLNVDASMATHSRLGVARVCVEVNLQGELPGKIWIGQGSSGFWQQIEYKNLPNYCSFCHKLGHNADHCRHRSTVPPTQRPVASHTQPDKHQTWAPKTAPSQTETWPSTSGLTP